MKFDEKQFVLTYQNQLDVIQDLKDKAWKAAYYSVLGQAAVFVLYRSVTSSNGAPSSHLQSGAVGLSILIFLWVLCLIFDLQGGICVRRERAKFLRKHEFDDRTFSEIWTEMDDFTPPNLCKRWKDDCAIFLAYLVAIIVPCLVVVALIRRWVE